MHNSPAATPQESGPRQRYESALGAAQLIEDPAQLAMVDALQNLFERLLPAPTRTSLLSRLIHRNPAVAPERGLYIWGGVGRGKTLLMDLFFESLPFDDKLRSHFHRFMHAIHAELKTLEKRENPLARVAKRIAARSRIICFDEFFVTDIADAMILGNLFEALFHQGVCLVTTSNIHPDALYAGGLQRQRFLPAIDLLKRHTRVIEVDGGVDYRLRVLERADIYHWPLDNQADTLMARYFDDIACEPGRETVTLEIEGRGIEARRVADGIVWFEFAAICAGPRGTADYIEIARCYHTVLISQLPRLDENSDNEARRFVTLVGEFYDHKVKLILSAEAPLADLYAGRRLQFEFGRTRSRLQEMQTHDYLAAAHLA